MDKQLTIIINENDISGASSDSGYYLDELATALGHWTSNELDENNFEYYAESAQAAANEFDYEAAFIKCLNNIGEKTAEFKQMIGADKKAFQAQPLKFGAWLALERPNTFSIMLDQFEESERENATNGEPTRSDLGAEYQKAYDWSQEYNYNEWLHGDRSNDGILDAFSKRLTDRRDNVEFVEAKSMAERSYLTVTATRAQMAEFCELEDDEYALLDDEQMKTRFKSDVIDWIENNAYSVTQKNKAESAERRAQNEKTRAYQAEQKAKAEAARIEKLKGMTK